MSSESMELDPHRWRQLWRRVSVRADEPAHSHFAELRARYAEPARHYHNAEHIAACLLLFDEVKGRVHDALSLEFAIWFHDVIYDPRARDNEERSAQFAADAVHRSGGSPELATSVAALVLATKAHAPGNEPDAPWLIDIDLAILGQPSAVFDAYERAIRAEYSWVDAATFCTKRAAVLRNFLSRENIFLTPHFRARLETTARENLTRSIARLDQGWVPD